MLAQKSPWLPQRTTLIVSVLAIKQRQARQQQNPGGNNSEKLPF